MSDDLLGNMATSLEQTQTGFNELKKTIDARTTMKISRALAQAKGRTKYLNNYTAKMTNRAPDIVELNQMVNNIGTALEIPVGPSCGLVNDIFTTTLGGFADTASEIQSTFSSLGSIIGLISRGEDAHEALDGVLGALDNQWKTLTDQVDLEQLRIDQLAEIVIQDDLNKLRAAMLSDPCGGSILPLIPSI